MGHCYKPDDMVAYVVNKTTGEIFEMNVVHWQINTRLGMTDELVSWEIEGLNMQTTLSNSAAGYVSFSGQEAKTISETKEGVEMGQKSLYEVYIVNPETEAVIEFEQIIARTEAEARLKMVAMHISDPDEIDELDILVTHVGRLTDRMGAD